MEQACLLFLLMAHHIPEHSGPLFRLLVRLDLLFYSVNRIIMKMFEIEDLVFKVQELSQGGR